MQRHTGGTALTLGLLVTAIAVLGFAVAEPGVVSAGLSMGTVGQPANAAVSVSPAASAPAWTASELRSASTLAAPYTEAGYHLAGAEYLGAPSLATAANPSGSVNVLVSLQFSNASRLNTFLAELSNPSSPEYHHYLTAAEFNAAFGPSPSVYGSLVSLLKSYGVSGLTTLSSRLTVGFEATPAQVQAIFHTGLGAYVSASGQPFYAPLSNPTVPAPLAPYILEVEGLSNYSEYLNHLAPVAAPAAAAADLVASADAARGVQGPLAPGGASNPFASTTVTSNGLTNTYDQPVVLNTKGKTGTCDANNCGNFVQAPDLQVTYNETGLFEKYGYPKNATVAAVLWSDPACYSSTKPTAACGSDDFYNYWCTQHITSGQDAWDFFMPDVTSFWNYSIPTGEPMPHAYSMAVASGYTYAYPTGSQGYSAACDDDEAQGENTLDVDMLGSMAPGANVFQTFAGSSTTAAINTVFGDLLSPSTSLYSTLGGFDTATAIADLKNVSVITNSWTTGSGTTSLGATWLANLKTAQTRGITVLGATGDSGVTVEPPAAQTGSAFGTVAIGGTTAALNVTTLLRGPAHLASGAAPYYGVGTGEIGWYEKAGTVDGFTSTYGGTGGVASTTTFPRGSFANASSDATGVCNAVRTGNYRCEPDIAAISNDTIVDLEVGPYSLNMTCWITTSCAAVAPSIETGTTSGSSPTVEGTYFIGTSIATQVMGGEIATIDYALHKVGQGWLGFFDPGAYAMGQKQYSGQLTLHSFYDVTTFTGADGLVTNYEAKVGFDLATGWGVIDAGNYTQNTMTYATTFTESGLAGGTSWTVKATPTVGDAGCTVSGSSCSNSATQLSTGTTASIAETYGGYTYTASATGYSAPGGTFVVHGAAGSVHVTFSQLFASPSANPNPVYTGKATTISAGATGGSGTFTNYAWSGLPSSCSSPGNVASFSCTPSSAGGYTVQVIVTDSNGGQITGSFSLTVSPGVSLSASATQNPVDEGQATTVSASASGGSGGYSYAWSGLPSGCGSPGDVASFACTPAPGDASGSPYTVQVLVTDSSLNSATASFSLVVDPALSAGTASANPNPVDSGQSTTISTSGASGGSGTYSYGWTGLPAGCGSPGDVASFGCVPSTAGTPTITLTVTDGNGATAQSSFVLTVNGALVASPSATVNPVDEDEMTTISAGAAGGSGTYSSYLWGGLPAGCTGSGASFGCTPSVGSAGSYTVWVNVTDTNGAWANSSFTLTVDPALTASPSANVNPVDEGQATTISAHAAGGSDYDYVWSGLPSGCGSPGDAASFVCTPAPGDASGAPYTVSVMVTDTNGEESMGSFTLVVDPALSVSVSATPNPVDVGQTTTVSANAAGGAAPYSYAWSGLAGSGCAGSGASFVCAPTTAGTYTVWVNVTDGNGFSVHVSFVLDVDSAVSAGTVGGTPNPVTVGTSTTISTTGATGGSGGYSYAWSGYPATCTPGDVASFSCTPTTVGTYTVELQVTDSNGETASASFELMVNPVGTFAVTFTESGLPSGTEWYVNITGGPSLSGTTTMLSTDLPNGGYTYTVASANKEFGGHGGGFPVAGSAVGVSVSFAKETFTVTYTETGIPAKKLAKVGWSVELNGTEKSAKGATISFSGLTNGSYPLLIQGPTGFTSSVASGSQTVKGTTGVTVTFTKGRTAVLSFHEKGLPKGSTWCVAVDGENECSSTGVVKFTALTPGSYAFAVTSPATGYTVTEKVGKVAVTSPVSVTKGTAVKVTFVATGGPGGKTAGPLSGVSRLSGAGAVTASWGLVGAAVAVASALALVGAGVLTSRRGGRPGVGSEE